MSIMGKIRMLTQISILKTLYMNFKTQKFVNAVKLPIWVGKHTKLDICRGGGADTLEYFKRNDSNRNWRIS